MYKKLLKRLLPVVLSVAVVVQSVPDNVFAAESVTLTEAVEESSTGSEDDVVAVEETSAESMADDASSESEITQNREEPVQATAVNEPEIVLEYKEEYCENNMTRDMEDGYYTYHESDHSFTTKYDGEYKGQNFYLAVNATVNEDSSSITSEWKRKEGDNYVALTDGFPRAVGTYYLEYSSTATSKINREIKLIIEKADLTIENSVVEVAAEPKVADAIEQIKEQVDYTFGDKDAASYVSATTVAIKEVGTETELATNEVLIQEKDYVAVITPTLTEEGAKILTATPKDVNITFSELKYVQILLSYCTNGRSPVVRTYTGEAVVAPDITSENREVYVYLRDGENDFNPTEEEISTAWYNSNKEKLEEVPVNVGTYYYGVTYTDQEKIYETTTGYIKVEIQPKTLYLKPVTQAPFYEGITAAELLDTISYKVYTDKEGKEEFTVPSKYFWGILRQINYEQAYEPSFKVQYKITAKDKTTVIQDWTDCKSSDEMKSTQKAQGSEEQYYAYRVLPTMKKEAHKPDSSGYYYANINLKVHGFSGNYQVVDLESYYLNVEVENANAVIDVSAILEELGGKGADVANRATGIYDENPIFANKSEYKNAVVKAGTTVVADGVDSSLSYLWIKGTIEDGKFVEDDSNAPSINIPCASGVYALEISYDDPDCKYAAAPKRIYFEIEKQKLLVKFAQKIKVAEGLEESDLDLNKESYTIYRCKDNKTDEANLEDTGWENKIKNIQVSVYLGSSMKDDITAYLPFYGTFRADKLIYYKLTGTTLENISDDYEVECEPVDIVVEARGDKMLTIVLKQTSKVYDGEPYDMTGITMKDGETTADLPATYFWTGRTKSGLDYESTEAPINAGSYRLTVTCEGNDTYAYVQETFLVTIEPKPVKMTPVIDQAVAGNDFVSFHCETEDAIVDQDRELISSDASVKFYEKGIYYENELNHVNDCLRYGVTYVAKLDGHLSSGRSEDADGNSYCVADNYKVINGTCEFTVDKRGNCRVYKCDVAIKDTVDGFVHTIVPIESIPYGKFGDDDTNVICIRIWMPKEYYADGHTKSFSNGDFVYANSIKQAGGLINRKLDSYIEVLFDASTRDKKEFEITWETGYTETFIVDLENAVLDVDRTKAVAPKSLAFNSPKTKMVVGEEQELDVKLTKTLSNDVVILNYRVDEAGADVLHIEETTGKVVALKKGTATVTVYPVVWNEETDQLEEIPMKKAVTTKITVSEVSAPKITSVEPRDKSVYVSYQDVSDGWRREIYIAEGNLSQLDFERKLDAVENDNYSAQGICFGKLNIEYSKYDSRKKIASTYIYSALEPSKEYTVYVRNVSEIRKFEDGCQVSESVAGSVKTFRTTKPYPKKIELHLQDDKGWVDISEKTVQLSTTVSYDGKVKDPAKDKKEYETYTLPMDKSEAAYYVLPKMKYSVYSSYYGKNNAKNKKSKIATIDKNGKVTLKGIGIVMIEACDSVSGATDIYELHIGATLDKMTAKSATVKVGEFFDLNSLVTVYSNNKKVNSEYEDLPIEYTVTGEGAELYGDNYLMAKEPGKTITVTATIKKQDAANPTTFIGGREDVKTTFTVQTKEMNKITELKAFDTINYTSKVGFYHVVYADSYKIGLKDGRGTVLAERLVSSDYMLDDYSSKRDAYYFVFDVNSITGLRLARLENYTVTVTPVMNNTEGSSVSCKFRTTDIPARNTGLDENTYGGLTLKDSSLRLYNGASGISLKSGNRLTLTVRGANAGAKESGSDTLIWKVDNTKIAKVQSGKGVASYTITVRGVKAGTTTLTATSSITKKVVMRRKITISAVGSADTNHGKINAYGEQEEYESDEVNGKDLYVGCDIALNLTKNEQKWLYFTPDVSGYYTLYSYNCTGDPYCVLYDMNYVRLNSNDNGGEFHNFSLKHKLEKGKTYSYVVRGYSYSPTSMNVCLVRSDG